MSPMSFEVFLHPSTTSPSANAFEAVATSALASIGAGRDADGEGVTLADGSRIELFIDGDDDIALLTLPTSSDATANAVYAVMAATRSFMLSNGFTCRVAETGEVTPQLAMAFPCARNIAGLEDMRDVLDGALLASQGGVEEDDLTDDEQLAYDQMLEAAAMATAPPPEADPIVSKPDKPLLQRISDALFGKSI